MSDAQLPPPDEALLVRTGQPPTWYPAVVIDARPTSWTGEWEIILHVWGDRGLTEMRLRASRVTPLWPGLLVVSGQHDRSAPLDARALVGQPCRVEVKARHWLADRNWIEIVGISPLEDA